LSATRIVHERNRAEEQRAAAQTTAAAFLEDQGRQELLEGNSPRALAYLAEAYKHGKASPSLRFLIATAMHDVEPPERTLSRDRSVVKRLQFSPDGKRLLVVAEETLEVWSLESRTRILAIPSADGFEDGHYSGDGTRILSRDLRGNRARMWDAATGLPICVFEGHRGSVTSAEITPNLGWVVTTSADTTWQIWDAASCKSLRTIATEEAIHHGTLSPDGHYFATWTFFGQGTVWDVSSAARVSSHDHDGRVAEARFGPDGKTLVSCGFDRKAMLGAAKLWEAGTGRFLRTLFSKGGSFFTLS
jgi:WD40 repeat protein